MCAMAEPTYNNPDTVLDGLGLKREPDDLEKAVLELYKLWAIGSIWQGSHAWPELNAIFEIMKQRWPAEMREAFRVRPKV